jgi:hypothetical protein
VDDRHHEILAMGDDLLDLMSSTSLEGVEEVADPFANPSAP